MKHCLRWLSLLSVYLTGQAYAQSLGLPTVPTLPASPVPTATYAAPDVQTVLPIALDAAPLDVSALGVAPLQGLSGLGDPGSPLAANNGLPTGGWDVAQSGAHGLGGLAPLAASGGERPSALGSFFDGNDDARKQADGSLPPGEWTESFLNEQFSRAREALRPGKEEIPAEALQAISAISFSRPYLDDAAYDAWFLRRGVKVAAVDRRLTAAVEKVIQKEIDEGDHNDARDAIEEIRTRYPEWARTHDGVLAGLSAQIPTEQRRAEPLVPRNEPAQLAMVVAGHLSVGKYREAEYYMMALEKRHPDWAHDQAATVQDWKRTILEGTYRAFEARKRGFSPEEARRLTEYMAAVGEGSNRGVGFRPPPKQDPDSRMCTILSLCEAFDSTVGFADKAMDAKKFTALVRRVLNDETLGDEKGLSTQRVRNLLKALGLPLKVIEMQERLKRPFKEAELVRLFRSDTIIIPVFIIAQVYSDELDKGIQREEHKGFLRDAFYSPSEKRWIYLFADPLIGRVSFYTWEEMKPFLHRLFVIKVSGPIRDPQAP